MKKLLTIFIAATAIFAGCSSDDTPVAVSVPVPELNTQEMVVAESINGFDLDFFKAMNEQSTEPNLVVSPISASMNLSLLANIVESKVRSQICDALGSSDIDALNSLTAKYMTWLPAADSHVNLKIANSLWYRDDFTLKKTFTDVAGRYYSAEVFARDFANGLVEDEINGWVSNKTGGLIDKILNPHDLLFALSANINTLYFKGEWAQTFDAAETEKATFNGTEGASSVPMMKAQRTLAYTSADEFEAVQLDFGSSIFSTVLILPTAGSDINDFIASDALAMFNNAKWSNANVALSLPKFKFQSGDMDLMEALRALGCDDINQALIDGLFEEKPYDVVSKIYQKTSVEFNEKGAEAAAVTWEVDLGGVPSTEMNVTLTFNRPFVFLIRESHTGRCLFAGKITKL